MCPVTKYDSVGFNQDHFNFYKKLAGIRNANPVLAHGKFRFELTEGKKLVYTRHDGKDEIVVVCNADEGKNAFTVPGDTYVDLITGKTVSGNRIELEPLSAMILKEALPR